MSEVKVRVEHLTKKFGDLLVLDDVSFDVMNGEFLCIVGPTGCGKTTFLNTLTKLYDITSGSITVMGEPMDLKKHNVSYIFQENSTMPWLSVEGNVAFGLKIKKVPRKERRQRVDEMLELVGLTPYRKYYPHKLSASMLQRVSIARAFATRPDLLLMDEPYAQLDLGLRYKLEDELVKLWKMTKTTVLFITHNVEEAIYLAQRVMVLTNKPTRIKQMMDVDMPYPRNISAPEFVELRDTVTDLIKWW